MLHELHNNKLIKEFAQFSLIRLKCAPTSVLSESSFPSRSSSSSLVVAPATLLCFLELPPGSPILIVVASLLAASRFSASSNSNRATKCMIQTSAYHNGKVSNSIPPSYESYKCTWLGFSPWNCKSSTAAIGAAEIPLPIENIVSLTYLQIKHDELGPNNRTIEWSEHTSPP